MQHLEANTGVDVRMGPFVDVGDGFTPQTDIGNPDTNLTGVDEAELLKHNGAATVDITARTWAAVTGCDGWYDLTLTTDDTNTEGLLDIVIQDDSDCLPVHKSFMVLSQAAYESLYGVKDSGLMQVDLVTVNDTATQLEQLMDLDTGEVADANLDGIVVDGSVLSHLMTTTALTDAYNATTDSLSALGTDVDTIITGVNVTSIGNDVITPASVDEDADFTIQALSITNQLDAGSVVIDDGIAITCSTDSKSAIKATGGATAGHALELIGTGTGLDVDAANLNYLAGITTGVAADADLTSYVADGSILSHVMTLGADTDKYQASTDSLQGQRDTLPAANATALATAMQADPTDYHVNLKEINDTATQLEQLMDLTTGINADADLTSVVVDKSILSHVMTPAANTDTYNASTDSLETIGGLTAATAIEAAVDAALENAIPASPTANSINQYIQQLKWVLVNQMAITEASGNVEGKKDDDSTAAYTVAGAFVSAAGTTTRKRLE